MTQAWAVVWAQWRSYHNFATKSSVAAAVLVGLLWYGLWTVVAIAAGLAMASVEAGERTQVVVWGALLVMTLYWQLMPIMMASTGLSLDLSKLKIYPIPVHDLFTIEVLLRTTAAMEMLLVLCGGAIGVLLNPNLPAWGALVAFPFAAFQLMLSLGFREIMARLLTKRRWREISAFLFVLLWLPQLVMRGRPGIGQWLEDHISIANVTGGLVLSPWNAAGHLLLGQDAAIVIVVLFVWTAVAGMFALWQFRRTLVFDPEASLAAGEIPAHGDRPGLMERFYRWPSAILGDPLSVLIEKELRYLARSPRFRTLFLMGSLLGLAIARGTFRASPAPWAPNYLVVESAYSLLLLGEVCIWNTFGFDRSAAQVYFLAPIPFARVLIAKNLAAAAWIGIQFIATLFICALLGFPVTPGRVAEAAATTTVVLIFFLAAGNYVAVSSPRPADPEASMKSQAGGGKQLLVLLVFPITLMPLGLAYLARWALQSDAVFFGMLAVMAGIGFVVYRVALDSTVEYANDHKEEMIAALSASTTPIAS